MREFSLHKFQLTIRPSPYFGSTVKSGLNPYLEPISSKWSG